MNSYEKIHVNDLLKKLIRVDSDWNVFINVVLDNFNIEQFKLIVDEDWDTKITTEYNSDEDKIRWFIWWEEKLILDENNLKLNTNINWFIYYNTNIINKDLYLEDNNNWILVWPIIIDDNYNIEIWNNSILKII